MKLISIDQYDPDTKGIEACVEKNGKILKAYLQMPETPDSEHSFLDENDDVELLGEIVNTVEQEYNSIELTMISEFGSTDYKYISFISETTGIELYIFVSESDADDYHYYVKSPYSEYYNVFLIEKMSVHHPDELLKEFEKKRCEA